MSRRRPRVARRSRRAGRFGAAVAFLVMMALLGGIANTTPVPHAVIGFLAVVVALLFWVGRGSRHHH